MNHFHFSSILLATTLLGNGIAAAAELQVIDGCATPPAALSGNVYYIDPVHGSAGGDGTQARPWKSLQAINGTAQYSNPDWQLPGCNGSTSSNCTSGPLLSTQVYSYVDPVSKKSVTSVNSNAPIKPGDTVLLMNGNHGNVSLNGVSNPSFITIAAAPGQHPVLGSLSLIGSEKWIVQGLKFRGLADGYSPFVDLGGNSWYGTGRDIILDSNDLASQDNVAAWTPANWVANGRYIAISVDGGDQHSTNEKCVAVTNNSIRNIRYGISVGADNMLVDGNTINNFGDDAIDFAGSNLVISHNRITNNRNIGDSNHNDAMQGQIGRGIGGSTVFDNILIDGNIVIAKARKNLLFAGDLQGISAFNMDWSNLTVINNIVITNAWHGIAFYSVHGGLLANNTVLASTNIGTWLGVFNSSHEGSATNNVIVRNNIASNMDSRDSTATTLTFDHNLVGTQIAWQVAGKPQWISQPGTYGTENTIDPARLAPTFKKFNISTATYDLHLNPSIAVGTGNPQAPHDMAGKPRKTPVDRGAYEYVPTAAAKAAAKVAAN